MEGKNARRGGEGNETERRVLRRRAPHGGRATSSAIVSRRVASRHVASHHLPSHPRRVIGRPPGFYSSRRGVVASRRVASSPRGIPVVIVTVVGRGRSDPIRSSPRRASLRLLSLSSSLDSDTYVVSRHISRRTYDGGDGGGACNLLFSRGALSLSSLTHPTASGLTRSRAERAT